ncbi:type IVB secretion system protein IcmH/DotU [Paracoccus sp. MC1862]|uniref:type IVB secretion system protein IcmH/DotU n=1 Tax=Paracoccus sp. MC1862 TaxID=2760307 RepID=UPI0015FF0ADD|nr:type IVB secretion system protein IcmH/DotU [Paracoccus sp. MC1862]MBB1499074.1 DotU family type IV/VI secretion system protein [Paracoccus sp. MC1862]QQO46075.1 type IVB secretion system protein IcmH/DotU [Paracoccus sp. MC1862]
MGHQDDPFGLGDPGRTRIRPIGAGRPLAEAQPPIAAGWKATGSSWQAGSDAAPRARRGRAHPNPLVAAHATLLELAPELERANPPDRPEALRARLQAVLIEGREASVAAGMPLARADQGAWFVAALLDDLALNTPWGGQSGWPRQPLVTQMSGEVDAGTRFFDRLETLMRNPVAERDLLELAWLCLCLGFRGKYRVQGSAGEGALVALRSQIARLLRDPEREAAPLAPHGAGVEAPDVPRRFTIPLWTLWLTALALALAIHAGLSMRLSHQAQELFVQASALPPPDRAPIFRPLRRTDAEPLVLTGPVVDPLLPEFERAVPTALRSALQGRETPGLAVLVVQASDPELFRSAKAVINPTYQPLIDAIGRTIVANLHRIGGVAVSGHTDNVPVQRSNPFASNQGLSEARAENIAKALAAAGVPPELLSAAGRADAEPVADNTTPQGRARNRRIEIRIEKRQ